MSSESAADHLRPVRLSAMATRPSEPEHLPCPRCDSINTKFCYYNNYNLSQPRHFCKSCRRYWTRGGTLRNVPVGGGSRKPAAAASNKRPRVDPTAAAVENEHNHHLPMSVPMATSAFAGCDVNLNEAVPEAPNFGSSFLNVNGGLLPYGNGFGLGLGSGLHGLGFGLGALDWAMDPISSHHEGGNNDVSHGGENGAGDVCGGDGTGSGSGGSPSHTWQMGSGVEGSLNDGDCFGWPDLAISMTGKGLK